MLIKLFKCCYKLLKNTIQEYRPNELYASQWLELLILQAKMTKSGGDIGAEDTLTELIDNNKKILETKIDQQTTFSFVEMLLEEKQEKYVKMIRALCVCDGQAMVLNQGKMSELILGTESLREQLVLDVWMEQGVIRVNALGGVELSEFKAESRKLENDRGATFKFFVEMTHLLSDLCMSRNYLAMDTLFDIYPLNLCVEIVGNPSYGFQLRTCFAQLVRNLWVDRAPYNKLVLPENIKIWNDIGKYGKSKFPITSHDIIQMQPLKLIVRKHLEKIIIVGSMKAWEQHQNEFTLSILLLLKFFQLICYFIYQFVQKKKDTH